jgi:hypothetical protein
MEPTKAWVSKSLGPITELTEPAKAKRVGKN